ncbi:magnesium transporter [Azospirillum doebereinerae]|uniref:magnesium transporter n=1 Tax=Azospirillum doebereinerae TaxID=92933 RepID=UPI001EE5C19E|nr:magnesium transporter [Azospirillum doebereinerae]MCG5243001.1 magnesium transporter [Azospirillum doebereinerae]
MRADPQKPNLPLSAPAPRDEAEDERRYGVEPEFVDEIVTLLRARERDAVRALLDDLHAADIADLIEQVDSAERDELIEILRPGFDGEVLSYLNPDLRESVVERFEPRELAAAVAELDTDDAVDLIEDLDEETRAQILANLPDEDRALVQENLTYDENTAGRMMQRDLVAVPEFWTVGKTIDHIRAATDDLPEDFYDIFVVDPLHRVVGAVPLSRMLRQRRTVRIADLVTDEVDTIPATMDQEEVANLFRQYALVSAPVVDSAGRLIGVITVDDVVHIIDEEAEEDLRKFSGSGDTGVFSGIADIARARVGWLTVNLATAFLASAVISLFEGTIEQIVALAVLMPIVASMGGNAGTQTLTVVVRALATHELSSANALRVVGKELLVGLTNGAIFAVMVGVIALIWFGPMIGVVIACAMIINMVVAGLCGALIPLGLDRVGVDPAVASVVFLTTVTDVVGFFAFLGLASAILL